MGRNKKIIIMLVVIVVIMIGILLILKGIPKSENNNKNETEKNTIEYEDNQEVNEFTEKYVEELEDGTKLNISNKLNETKMLEGLKISNIQLTYKNGMSIIIADVENTTNGDIGLTPINLKLYDEQGNILETLDGLISEVKSGEKTQLNIGISSDYANAYDISIEKK